MDETCHKDHKYQISLRGRRVWNYRLNKYVSLILNVAPRLSEWGSFDFETQSMMSHKSQTEGSLARVTFYISIYII